jgi:hypothetical protein
MSSVSTVQRSARTLASACGLCIGTVGIAGIVWPAALVWIAQQFVAFGASAFYALATVRIAFGLLLISAAPGSRVPRGLRILGGIVVILGIVTALAGSVAIERSLASIESWEQQGHAIVRMTGGAIVALGSFVAYACAPQRDDAGTGFTT